MGDVASKTQGKVGTGGVSRFNVGTNNSSNTSKPPLSFEQAYPAAVEQTGEDYSNIMGGYQNLLDSSSSDNGLMQNYQSILNRNKQFTQTPNFQSSTYNPLDAPERSIYNSIDTPIQSTYKSLDAPTSSIFNPLAAPQNIIAERQQYGSPAEQQQYSRDPDVISSLARLRDLTETGGYSGADIANLRARGISPIRSVYANATNNMDRQRSLQGGYSPNFNAASSKMAREQSDLISGVTQNVNAGIAENVARNKLSASPLYAQASENESNVQKNIDASNVAARNRANEMRSGVDATNMAARNRANEINAQNVNETNRFNTSGINETNLFNTGNFNRINEANALGINDTNRFNTENSNRVNEANNQGINQTNLFNMGNLNRINEANAQGINESNARNTQGMNAWNQTNNQNTIDMNKFNSGLDLQTLEAMRNESNIGNENKFKALSGMQGLYGTNPALAALFGDQAAEAARLKQGATAQNQGTGLNLINQQMNLPRVAQGGVSRFR